MRDESGKKVINHYISYPWEDIQETREYRGKPWHIHGNPYVWVVEFRKVHQEDVPLFESCESVGECPRPTAEAAPYHHFYWDHDRDIKRMDEIHGPNGKGHDDPMSKYGAVICKTCEFQALVKEDSEDFPEI